jgi:hypothetical protein
MAELISSSMAELISSSLAEVAGLARQIVRCCFTCPGGIIRTAACDVNVPFMQLDSSWNYMAGTSTPYKQRRQRPAGPDHEPPPPQRSLR